MVYISCSIKNTNNSSAILNFEAAEKVLQQNYFFGEDMIINPLKFQITNDDKEDLIECISRLIRCNAIYMLNNWGNSTTSRIEYAIAKELGLTIIFEASNRYLVNENASIL